MTSSRHLQGGLEAGYDAPRSLIGIHHNWKVQSYVAENEGRGKVPTTDHDAVPRRLGSWDCVYLD